MTPELGTTVQILQAKREAMKAACAGIGEPAVEIPLNKISAYKDEDGIWHAVIGVDQLIYLVDGLLRRS